MSDRTWLTLLQKHRAIAVIRAHQMEIARQMAKAAAAGGMHLIEITWNSDRAPDLIRQLRSALPEHIIGTGTLLNRDELQLAIEAGAQFLFTPHTDPETIALAAEAGVPLVPGALSPTEIVTAWHAGASAVKVFPISAVGGASYVKSLQGPLGHIPLIPTGGVTLENAKEFIEAGAIAVGLADDLFPKPLMAVGNWQAIESRVRTLVQRLTLPTLR